MQNDELIRANDALEKAKKKFEDIYDFSTICYFSLGRDGIIQGMNLSAANLLGNARSGLVGRNFRMFVSQGERRAFDGFLEKVFNNKIKTAIETILAGSGKSPANVYVEGAAGDDSSVCQLNLIDITERKQDEATIKSLVEKLEYSNEQLEAFAYTISHDLQSPIGSITGFITLIEKQNAGLMNED
jgi:PAS domain S-box-containing protein